MPRVAEDYESAVVGASRAALLELAATLGTYRDALILVGGWVPYLLLKAHQRPEDGFKHVGSIDIDLVADQSMIGENEYATIVNLIEERDWKPKKDSLFSFLKSVKSPVDSAFYEIQVDFLTPEPEKLAGKHRHRQIQPDLKARTMAGAPIAISHQAPVKIEGTLPTGAEHSETIRMADVSGCVGMKGLILGGKHGRYKEKDAYDLCAVLEHFGDGPKEVAAAVMPFKGEELMAEAQARMREWFAKENSPGPICMADFFPAESGEARRMRATRAFAVVASFLEELG